MVAEPASAEGDSLGLVGETVAERFVVEQLVAEGGFGMVYRARQIGLDRPVALKVLKPPASSAAFQQTFEAEARTIARLVHPNIVAVHDFGVADRRGAGPLHWIALEWLEGRTLEAMLQERRAASMPFTPAGALDLLRPVIESIAFAHERGVVHRDLKPLNIFLHQQAGGEVPRVLDFGVARMATPDEQATHSGAVTTRSFAVFSPDYAAPEQVTHGRTGPWTDVHALGLILTELLTGQPPYGHSSSTKDEDSRFEAVISTHRPTPGSKGVGVGPWEQVLVKALSRRPADRHPNAGALLKELDRALPASEVSAEAPPPRRRGPWLSRWRIATGATLAVLLAVATVSWRSLRTEPTGRVLMAVLPFENLTGDSQQEYLADGLTDGMISEIGRIAPDHLAVIARTSVTQYKGTKKGVKQIARELGVSHLLESSVKRGEGRIRIDARLIQVTDETQVWADAFDREMKDVLTLQNEIARAIAAGVRIKLDSHHSSSGTRSVNPAAYDAYLRARHMSEHFSRTMKEGRDYFAQAIERDPGYAPAYAGLARTFLSATDVPPLEALRQAKAAAQRSVELNPGLSEAQATLARVLLQEGDWAGAERHFRRGLAIDPNDGYTLVFYAQLQLTVGRFTEAIAARKRAAELSPTDMETLVHVPTAYYAAHRYDEAIAHLRRLLELDPKFSPTYHFLGASYLRKGMYREALAATERCDSPICLARITVWAHALSGDTPRALEAIERLKGMARTRTVSPVEFARAYAALGHRDEVLAWLERAYEERSFGLIFLRTDREWDQFRGDPRFQDLIRRVGIPPLSRDTEGNR